jgi:hypothetical protein
MTVRKTSIMLYHQELELKELLEKVHVLDFFWLSWRRPRDVCRI